MGGESPEPACGASVNSLKLLYRLTPGKTGVTQQSPALRGILHVGLLDVLFAVEPLSYFLFFVDEGKAIDLPTPMRLDAPSRVPFGANTKGLARKIAEEPGSSHAQSHSQSEEMHVVEPSSKIIKHIIIKKRKKVSTIKPNIRSEHSNNSGPIMRGTAHRPGATSCAARRRRMTQYSSASGSSASGSGPGVG